MHNIQHRCIMIGRDMSAGGVVGVVTCDSSQSIIHFTLPASLLAKPTNNMLTVFRSWTSNCTAGHEGTAKQSRPELLSADVCRLQWLDLFQKLDFKLRGTSRFLTIDKDSRNNCI